MTKRNYPTVHTDTGDGTLIPGDHTERLKRTTGKARDVLWVWYRIYKMEKEARRREAGRVGTTPSRRRYLQRPVVVSSTEVSELLAVWCHVTESPRTVRFHIAWLVERGYLEKVDSRRRELLITRRGRNLIRNR